MMLWSLRRQPKISFNAAAQATLDAITVIILQGLAEAGNVCVNVPWLVACGVPPFAVTNAVLRDMAEVVDINSQISNLVSQV